MAAPLPLEIRRAMLSRTPTYRVRDAMGTIPLNVGSPVSSMLTLYPTCSGIQQYMTLRIYGQIKNSGAAVATRTEYGGANVLGDISYTDPFGIDRTNIDGIGLELMNLARQRDPIGALSSIDDNYGVKFRTWGSDVLPPTIAAGATVDFSHTFVLPFAYSNADQRGAIMANQAGSNQILRIRFPQKSEAVVLNTANSLRALYTTTGAVAMTFETLGYELVTATKNYGIDTTQLPVEDFAVSYILQGGAYTGMAANSDFKIPYQAGRTHPRTFVVFDNGGALNTGSDVNSLSMLFGGSQDVMRLSPELHNFESKWSFSSGLPAGTYFQTHEDQPTGGLNLVNTGGSADFVINCKTVNANATMYEYIDYFTQGQIRNI